MTNRVALITGGASGIGLASARALAGDGYAIAIVDYDGEAAQQAADGLQHTGVDAIALTANVADAAQVETAVARMLDRFGRLDALINSAGISCQQAPMHEYPLEAWQRGIGINLSGTFHAIRYAVPPMLAAASGAIVNIASVMGAAGHPNGTAYVASKHGVVGLTKAAALDYADKGIRVNAVGPGVIETAMTEPVLADAQVRQALTAATPMGRLGKPDEIAALVRFLCSDEAGFITGQYLPADGGYLAQ